MKRLIFFAIVSLLTLNSFAQNAEQEIRKTIFEYIKYCDEKNFSKAVEYMIDDFFEIIPKQSLIDALESAFNNTSVIIENTDNKIIEVGKIEKIKDKYYSIVPYSFLLKMRFKDIDEETKIAILFEYEEEFGEENVKYNEKTDFFELKLIEKMVAVSKNGSTNWKLIKIEENQKAIMEKLLPEKILKEALKK